MTFSVRAARTDDVPAIQALIAPLVEQNILLGKDPVFLYESIQEFRVAVDAGGTPIGCGAVHVMWRDLAEVRTLAVSQSWLKRGVGRGLLHHLEADARELGIRRLFCLTFETEFFVSHGFEVMSDEPLEPEIFAELVRSTDEGVAEFLDLARVKPNTLGNTRMLKLL